MCKTLQKMLIVVAADFQMMFTPKAFAQECKRWKPLIQLNLIRSILVILDNLVVDPSMTDLDVDNYLNLDPTMSSSVYSLRAVGGSSQHLLGAKLRTVPDGTLRGDGLPCSGSHP